MLGKLAAAAAFVIFILTQLSAHINGLKMSSLARKQSMLGFEQTLVIILPVSSESP